MMGLVRDGLSGLTGVFRVARFSPDWRDCFDFSLRGLVRSFGAFLLAIPLMIFFRAGYDHILIESGRIVVQMPLWFEAASYVLPWLTFPVIIGACVRVLGRGETFAPWLVMHNWAVLALYLILSFVISLALSGLVAPTVVLGLLGLFYEMARLGLHWRIATLATGVGPALGAGLAMTHMLADRVLLTALRMVAESGMEPGA